MSTETLARWQFGITTVYHFLFVPITLAMSFMVAIFQTIWVRTGNEAYLRLTKFYGKLFLINFAMGVVTGLVQEFQFGMSWSEYSRFVGDIFGAPLALEALLAFFLESTFLGLWIFGWDRLPKKVHLLTIWLAAIGTNLSALFILAANSFMQNPVGWRFNPATNRAELADFGAVMTNPVLLVTVPHQLTAAWMVAGALTAAVAGWHLHRLGRGNGQHEQRDEKAYRAALKIGAIAMLIGSLGVMGSGDAQGKVMTQVQPMKMAAAEALYETEQPADFSVLTIGTLDGKSEVWALKIPRMLSFLAHSNFTGKVQGVHELNAQYNAELRPKLVQAYGPEVASKVTTFNPNIPLTYWTFRLMIGLGMLGMAIAVLCLWQAYRKELPRGTLFLAAMIALPLGPLFANSFGWIFTETGRQPWLVFGVMPTLTGVSPGVTPTMVWISMATFTLLYGVLAVIEVKLFLKYIRLGLPEVEEPKILEHEDAPLSFAY